MAQWKQYSGMWTRQSQMQAAGATTWPNYFLGNSAFSWGMNQYGQLGNGNTTYRSSPVQIGSELTWNEFGVGYGYVGAVKLNNSLWTWGYNGQGQLGLSDKVSRSSTAQVGALTNWSLLAASNSGALVSIKTDGTLWSWGSNYYGELGQNDTVYRSSPVQIGAQSGWSNISGGSNDCCAIKTDGTLWGWGRNFAGMLGQNNVISRSSPVQIGADTDWNKVSVGANFFMAIKTNGALWTCGLNNASQLGLGNNISRSSPVQVGALTNWLQISCGGSHVAAIKNDGTIWTWGYNNYGQLGQNLSYGSSVNSPVQVGSSSWIGAASIITSVIAQKSDGTIWGWGQNNNGQIGQNTYLDRSSPVQIPGASNWKRLFGGGGASNCFATIENSTPAS